MSEAHVHYSQEFMADRQGYTVPRSDKTPCPACLAREEALRASDTRAASYRTMIEYLEMCSVNKFGGCEFHDCGAQSCIRTLKRLAGLALEPTR